MFAGINTYLIVGLVIIIACMAGGGYLYFSHAQAQIAQLSQDKARLETAVQLQEQTIAAQQEAAARQNQQMFALQQSMAQAEGTRRELEARLRRADLQNRARANSAETESRINRATVQAFRDIELLTQPQDRPRSTAPAANNTIPAAQPSGAVQPPPRPPVRGTTP